MPSGVYDHSKRIYDFTGRVKPTKYPTKIEIRVSEKTKEQLEKLSKKKGVGVSELIRKAIKEYYNIKLM